MAATLPAASSSEAQTDDVLTLSQMEARYPDEWLLIESPELDDDMEIIKGRIIAHSPDRALVFQYDKQHRPRSAAYLFTGALPDAMAVNL